MRVYVPLTLPALSQAHGAGELGPAPFEAYAVTAGLRAWWGSENPEDEEELEYAALGLAAASSLRSLARDAEAVRRRVVVVAEVSDALVHSEERDVADGRSVRDEDAASVGRVRLTAAVPISRVAAVHLDAEEAVEAVTAAIDALPAAAGGDQRAQAVVDGAEEHELLWFATQEIPALIA
ncbi:hypothetical protein MMF93_13115 [Streptomyces tubbatahanensis]|uniref:Uncharacterized protein n=1 Tax=Streptomyces tubbatahanensis TaxID=2923272 RepID=A0ABY3XSE5_9ACTN|nr:hypothetical protein [Streptomyces tubbatahanensis]UNS97335.1 hypothetical protein MMF93_13115 [Streptomyces tubbatahanensis]